MLKYLITLGLAMMSFMTISAQNGSISGVVKDQTDPLPFANVAVDVNGETTGVQTDFDGKYKIELPAGTHILNITYVGYEPKQQEVTLTAGQNLTMDLEMSKGVMMKEVVLTAGKFEQERGEVTVSMEVIQPDFIENANTPELDKAIEKVPGVDVIDGQANIRGGSGYSYGAGSRVMLLMDGLPVLTADSGFPNWDFLPIENIGQVEIIKGASSALYGSSAMNGVVNLRTAYATSKPFTRVSLFGGYTGNPRDSETGIYQYLGEAGDTLGYSDDDERPVGIADSVAYNKNWWAGETPPHEAGFSFAHRQRFGNLDVVMGTNWYTRKSWRETSYSRRGRINVNLRYKVPNSGFTIGLNTNGMLNRSGSFLIWNGQGPDAYRLWTATPPINNKGTKLTVDPFIEYFDEARSMTHKILTRYYKNNNETDTGQSTNSDYYYGEYQLQKRFSASELIVTTGIAGSMALSDAELYDNGGQYKASNIAGYLQLDKKFFEKLNVSVGMRYESNSIGQRNVDNDTLSVTEAKPVFRAGVNYKLGEYTFIRGSFGQAYRFPTIAEKFVRTDLGEIGISGLEIPLGIYPNSGITSETGWSGEIGLQQGLQISDWQGFIDIAGFVNEYQDMLEFTFGAGADLKPLLNIFGIWEEYGQLDTSVVDIPDAQAVGFQSINIGNTRILGLDVSLAGKGDLFGMPTTLLAGYTHTSPRFKDFNEIEQILSSSDENILKYRFRNTIKGDIETRVMSWLSLGMSARYYSPMEAIDEAFNRFLPDLVEFREKNSGGSLILDARASFVYKEKTRLAFLVKNLTNLEYALRPALIDQPISFTVKLSYDF